jgi:glycosyltransferase involved in cell wall biosynthesis
MLTERRSSKWQGECAYILITPAKDEEASLPALIESIANQTLRPLAWFIVDDGSQDRTSQIIDEASSKHLWIYAVKSDTKQDYDIGEHYASVCIKGFDQALSYCEQNGLEFGYIALSDADMTYPEDYFAECVGFLHNNSQYGIVGGSLLIEDTQGNIYEENKFLLGDGAPRGTGRVWRRDAFADTGGYMLTKSPDSVSNVMALLRGWKIKRLSDVQFYQTRDTGAKIGLWDGYFNRGERAHYLNKNPLTIFNSIIVMLFISREKNAIIKSLAFLSGYCKSLLKREEQIENDEVRRYWGSYRNVMRNYCLFLGQLRKKKRPQGA